MNKCKVCDKPTAYILCVECEQKHLFPPCKDCTSRHPHCHSQCLNYTTYRMAVDSRRARKHDDELVVQVRGSILRKKPKRSVGRNLILKSKKGR